MDGFFKRWGKFNPEKRALPSICGNLMGLEHIMVTKVSQRKTSTMWYHLYVENKHIELGKNREYLGWVAQLVGVSSCTLKVVGSIPGWGMCGRQQIDVFSLSLPSSLSKAVKKGPQVRIKSKNIEEVLYEPPLILHHWDVCTAALSSRG